MILQFLAWITWVAVGIIAGLVVARLLRKSQGSLKDALIGAFGAVVGGVMFDQLGTPRITDFDLVSTLVASIFAILTSVLVAILNADVVTQWDTSPTGDGVSMRKPIDHTPKDTIVHEPMLLVGRRRIHFIVPLLIILLLPLLDMLLLRIRMPDITSRPPDFGRVASYQNEHGQLNYLVYTPASYTAGTPIPVFVLLHGCIQSPFILESASGMRAVADTNGFILVYPEQNAASSPHRCWNFYDTKNQQRDSGEPALIVGIVNQVKQDYSVDARRVYVAGISSGGAMTSILASCYPDVFAAGAVHSGLAYGSATSIFQALIAPIRGSQTPPDVAGRNAYACSGRQQRPVPVLVLHGTADIVVMPINGQHTLGQFAQTNDFADDDDDNDSTNDRPARSERLQVSGGYHYTVEDFQHEGVLLMQKYTVEGLSHMWSGGTGIYPLSDPKSLNASQIIWDFLRLHSLPN